MGVHLARGDVVADVQQPTLVVVEQREVHRFELLGRVLGARVQALDQELARLPRFLQRRTQPVVLPSIVELFECRQRASARAGDLVEPSLRPWE